MTVFVSTHYMDKAEYCGRVGIMRDGRLLALDTPTDLKVSVIPGDVGEVHIHPLELGLGALKGVEGILRVGLTGDHLRVITQRGFPIVAIKKVVPMVQAVERGEPTL